MSNEDQATRIRAALAQLDPANPDHWTDDNLPKTAVVQRILSDQTIKRQDIQNAMPGFERPPVEPATDDFGAPLDGGTTLKQGAPLLDAESAAAQNGEDGEYLTEAEVEAILKERVAEFDQAVKDARKKQADGAKEEREALIALNKAKAELNSAFPPKTAEQNVKDYIASENAKRAARAGGGVYPNARVDQAMARSNSRGWRRPIRAVMGADGNLMRGPDGQIAMPRPVQARPVPRAV